MLNVLVSGDEGEVNEVRALQRLAEEAGTTATSRPLSSPSTVFRATRVCALRSSGFRVAGSWMNETAPGISSIHSSTNGRGPHRSPTAQTAKPATTCDMYRGPGKVGTAQPVQPRSPSPTTKASMSRACRTSRRDSSPNSGWTQDAGQPCRCDGIDDGLGPGGGLRRVRRRGSAGRGGRLRG